MREADEGLRQHCRNEVAKGEFMHRIRSRPKQTDRHGLDVSLYQIFQVNAGLHLVKRLDDDTFGINTLVDFEDQPPRHERPIAIAEREIGEFNLTLPRRLAAHATNLKRAAETCRREHCRSGRSARQKRIQPHRSAMSESDDVPAEGLKANIPVFGGDLEDVDDTSFDIGGGRALEHADFSPLVRNPEVGEGTSNIRSYIEPHPSPQLVAARRRAFGSAAFNSGILSSIRIFIDNN